MFPQRMSRYDTLYISPQPYPEYEKKLAIWSESSSDGVVLHSTQLLNSRKTLQKDLLPIGTFDVCSKHSLQLIPRDVDVHAPLPHTSLYIRQKSKINRSLISQLAQTSLCNFPTPSQMMSVHKAVKTQPPPTGLVVSSSIVTSTTSPTLTTLPMGSANAYRPKHGLSLNCGIGLTFRSGSRSL